MKELAFQVVNYSHHTCTFSINEDGQMSSLSLLIEHNLKTFFGRLMEKAVLLLTRVSFSSCSKNLSAGTAIPLSYIVINILCQ